ncbi:MAG: hypothetical protein WBD40_06930, partial [Tepidisphaeraceae bacterium]
MIRLNPNGSLDTTFDGDGIETTDYGTSTDKAHDVTVQPDGKIVIVGSGGGDLILGRYNTDGSQDTTFSTDGEVKTDFGGLAN